MTASLEQIRPDPCLGSARMLAVDALMNLDPPVVQLPPLSLQFLREITQGFSSENAIGRGGFGVFYGKMVSENTISVKRIYNKAKLLGIAPQDELCGMRWAQHLRNRRVSAGLQHNNLHLDLKPDHILLDDNSVPKIAEIGLSGFLDGNTLPLECMPALRRKSDIFDLDSMRVSTDNGRWRRRLHKALASLCGLIQQALLRSPFSVFKRIEDSFSCVKSMVPKSIIDVSKRLHSGAWRKFCQVSSIDAKPKSETPNAGTVPEFNPRESIGRSSQLIVNEAQHHSDPDSCGAIHDGIKAVEAKTSATWVVATAAPHHATGNRALLSGFITGHDDQFVRSVSGTPMQVRARGAVVTDTMALPDVWFVPGLMANLVSVSQLAELDYSVGFGRGECCIRSAADGKVVGKARLQKSGLYVLDFLKVPLAI